jgi:hypothetical protein
MILSIPYSYIVEAIPKKASVAKECLIINNSVDIMLEDVKEDQLKPILKGKFPKQKKENLIDEKIVNEVSYYLYNGKLYRNTITDIEQMVSIKNIGLQKFFTDAENKKVEKYAEYVIKKNHVWFKNPDGRVMQIIIKKLIEGNESFKLTDIYKDSKEKTIESIKNKFKNCIVINDTILQPTHLPSLKIVENYFTKDANFYPSFKYNVDLNNISLLSYKEESFKDFFHHFSEKNENVMIEVMNKIDSLKQNFMFYDEEYVRKNYDYRKNYFVGFNDIFTSIVKNLKIIEASRETSNFVNDIKEFMIEYKKDGYDFEKFKNLKDNFLESLSIENKTKIKKSSIDRLEVFENIIKSNIYSRDDYSF